MNSPWSMPFEYQFWDIPQLLVPKWVPWSTRSGTWPTKGGHTFSGSARKSPKKGNNFSRLSYTWKRMVTLQRWSNVSNSQSRLVPLSIAIYSYPWLSITLVNLPKQGLPICPVKKSQASLFCLFLGHIVCFEVVPARSIWPKKLQRRADDHRWRWHSQGFGMV